MRRYSRRSVEIGISKEKILGCIIITSSVRKYLQGTLVKQWNQNLFEITFKVHSSRFSTFEWVNENILPNSNTVASNFSSHQKKMLFWELKGFKIGNFCTPEWPQFYEFDGPNTKNQCCLVSTNTIRDPEKLIFFDFIQTG